MKKTLILIVVFLIGGIGGAVLPSFLSPVFSRIPLLSRIRIPTGDQTVIVNKTEQLVVQQADIAGKVYAKNNATVVSVKAIRGGSVVSSGFGFVVSSDGMILTRREWVSAPGATISIMHGSDVFSAEVIKKSDESGIVLLKAKASNLSSVSFSQDKAAMGTPLFLIGIKQGVSGPLYFMNSGIIKSVDGPLIETNMKEDPSLATGAPLLDSNGDVAGIASVNSAGYVFGISADAIMQFIR